MSKWFAYIVRCADGNFYTGIAKDVAQRVAVHNSGKGAKYTRGRLPVELVWQEEIDNEGDARRREMVIKKMTRQEKEELIGFG